MSEDNTKGGKKKLSFEEIKKRKKPAVRKVPIAFNSERADELNSLRVKVEGAKDLVEDNPRDKSLRSEYNALKVEFEELANEMEDEVVTFVFRSIGRSNFDQVIEECPPTSQQLKEASNDGEDPPSWNTDTFPPAIIAAAIVEPELTEEQVYEIWESEDWSHAEVASLYLAALDVNQSRTVVDLGKEFG